MFGSASSTAQESVLESLLTSQVYAGVSLLTKCDGVFSDPKGPAVWNGGESSARAVQSKAEGEPLLRKTPPFFFQRPPTRAIPSKAEEEPCFSGCRFLNGFSDFLQFFCSIISNIYCSTCGLGLFFHILFVEER